MNENKIISELVSASQNKLLLNDYYNVIARSRTLNYDERRIIMKFIKELIGQLETPSEEGAGK